MEPLEFDLTTEELQRARFIQGCLELQRLERNLRDYQRDLMLGRIRHESLSGPEFTETSHLFDGRPDEKSDQRRE